MAKFNFALVICVLALNFWFLPYLGSAQLRPNFYSNPNSNFCPNLENIVKGVVSTKVQQTFVTIPATLRLFFHDCFVNGCDASVIIQSAGSNVAEKDHPDNLSLAGDGFDTVIKAKAAVDKQCGANKVSCADILALATRDVVVAAGGPSWQVELGRKDGFVSTKSSVEGNLPKPTFNLNQLNAMFNRNGLSQTDMIALSGAHTLGFSHCSKFSNRIYSNPPDPTMNKGYAAQLRQMCPKNVNPLIAINMDPVTPKSFDIQYYKNLQQGKGLFTSDQVLFTDSRSRGLVNAWATNSGIAGFNQAFTTAMIKLGRVGVKTGKQGNVRKFCDRFN